MPIVSGLRKSRARRRSASVNRVEVAQLRQAVGATGVGRRGQRPGHADKMAARHIGHRNAAAIARVTTSQAGAALRGERPTQPLPRKAPARRCSRRCSARATGQGARRDHSTKRQHLDRRVKRRTTAAEDEPRRRRPPECRRLSRSVCGENQNRRVQMAEERESGSWRRCRSGCARSARPRTHRALQAEFD